MGHLVHFQNDDYGQVADESVFFDPSNSLSTMSFLIKFKLAFDTYLKYNEEAMWILPLFVKCSCRNLKQRNDHHNKHCICSCIGKYHEANYIKEDSLVLFIDSQLSDKILSERQGH